ncbi:amidase [Paenibacillus amylolyticus]|uniref:amidase n=1 Tax=Paenibacillus amylolyticus TaxID=1451 RepID=UPI0039AF09FA
MITKPLNELTIAEAATLIKNKLISPVELTKSYLDRIEKVEPAVQAFVTVTAEQALQAARESEEKLMNGEYLGPLHGIPYGAKDIIHTAGIRTSAGSSTFPDFVPGTNATVINKLQAAGAILLGKTTTTEYAFQGGEPPTRNPWNLEHTPGGSSSGSAAAVAAGMASFTLGTQTFGSLLRPAAYNGLTCMKPTYGRVSRNGVITASWSLDHIGAFTRSAQDNAIVLEAMAGQDELDPFTLPHGKPDLTNALEHPISEMVIGLPSNFFQTDEPAILLAVESAIAVLEKLGMQWKKVDLPSYMGETIAAHRTVMRAEAAAFHQERFAEASDRYGHTMREQLELGYQTSAVDYLQAQRIRTIFRSEMMMLFDEVDVLLTPSTPYVAPHGYKTGSPIFNGPFTNTGLPSITVPIGFDTTSGKQLPIGMQLAGPLMREDRLLSITHHYQQATNWHQLTPFIHTH